MLFNACNIIFFKTVVKLYLVGIISFHLVRNHTEEIFNKNFECSWTLFFG